MTKIPSHLKAIFERGGTLIVPTRQRSHAVHLAHAAEQLACGRRAWPSPDVLPLEGWLAREIERHVAASSVRVPRLLSPAEHWLLWRESTQECLGAREVLDPGALAEALRAASALASRLALDPKRWGDAHGGEPALLCAAQRAFERRCRELGATVAAALIGTLPALGGSRPVLFAGFAASTPQIEALLRARAERGFAGARVLGDPGDGTPATPRVLVASDEIEELEAIADWCRERLAAKPESRLLVLMPGSAGRRERLATLIDQALAPDAWLATPAATESPANVILEGAGSLGASPAVAHALTGLRLLAGTSLEFEALSEWLRSPCCAAAPAAGRALIDLALRERGAIRLDLHQFLAALRSLGPPAALAAERLAQRLESAARELSRPTGSPREWSERCRAALEALGWPGEGHTSAEQQIVLRFSELLEELGQLSSAARALARTTAVAWLGELAAHTAYRPADDDAPVTIAADFTDPVVRYDGIWVAGLAAEVFPEPVDPDPFLPLAAQRAAGHPAATPEGRLAQARAVLASWRVAADALVLSVPRRVGDLDTLPSPMLEGWQGRAERLDLARGRLWLPMRVARSGLLETCDDERGIPWDRKEPLPGGTRSLELQNQCPFRAYAELRLGSRELGVPEPGISADFRGRLLHAALERLWTQLGDSATLAALEPGELERRIEASVSQAANTLLEGAAGVLLSPPMVRERARAARLLRSLCELERQRAPFRVEQTERTLPLVLCGIALNVRIDRVDALEAGGRAILDYKSGRPVAADWYGERPSHPQLLAYLAALEEEVVALATVNVTAREVKFEGVAASAELLPKVGAVRPTADQTGRSAWTARVTGWRECVERLARDFTAGAARVDPRPGACQYCHVAPVCRVADDAQLAASLSEEANGG